MNKPINTKQKPSKIPHTIECLNDKTMVAYPTDEVKYTSNNGNKCPKRGQSLLQTADSMLTISKTNNSLPSRPELKLIISH